MMVELWMRKREVEDKDEHDMEDMRGHEKSGVRLTRLDLEDLISVMLPAGSGLIRAISMMVN